MMIQKTKKSVYFIHGKFYEKSDSLSVKKINQEIKGLKPIKESQLNPELSRSNTIACQILDKHNISKEKGLMQIKFDALASHDITYVSIILTARASGLKSFPLPYVLTNCHNSLCSVGGTINEDDHVFGMSAARKYGGIFVPANQAVIHQYMREKMAVCGAMILGSDSHTRYGALGTMGIGEGGGELVKQLLNRTYDISPPEVIAVYLEGKPGKGVGPQDVALALIFAVFQDGFAKNRVLEFIGPGIANLSVDFRNGVDVMTTETTSLSSIWITDEKTRDYFQVHGRPEAYQELGPKAVALYDGLIKINLDKIEPMIALPFHPSNVYSIRDFNRNSREILERIEEEAYNLLNPVSRIDRKELRLALMSKIEGKRFKVDQGIIAGCAGGLFENISEAADILSNRKSGSRFLPLSIYPASQPVNMVLLKAGVTEKLMDRGAVIGSAFCGPCFGACDIPANGMFSIRHTTRNFPNREGSKPDQGQMAYVALMDARSIAATVINDGFITPATEIAYSPSHYAYSFNSQAYERVVYRGEQKPDEPLIFGPNIVEWPKMYPLFPNLLLKVASVINDPVTTTDELIPSGETSSYRSNPLKLAEFTLSKRDPGYIARAKEILNLEEERRTHIKEKNPGQNLSIELYKCFHTVMENIKSLSISYTELIKNSSLGSVIVAVKPGDGSAREQAASCQKVLGGAANIAVEYATKRYRSNLINWGLLPFILPEKYEGEFCLNDLIFVPDIQSVLRSEKEEVCAFHLSDDGVKECRLFLPGLSQTEREILLAGCLINRYKGGVKGK
jgi:aconitate hydratase